MSRSAAAASTVLALRVRWNGRRGTTSASCVVAARIRKSAIRLGFTRLCYAGIPPARPQQFRDLRPSDGRRRETADGHGGSRTLDTNRAEAYAGARTPRRGVAAASVCRPCPDPETPAATADRTEPREPQ